MTARRFVVLRHGDSYGPIGVVAEGVQFSDGTVVVRCVPPSRVATTTLDSISDLEYHYSQTGNTVIEWTDEESPSPIPSHQDPNFHTVCDDCWQFALGHPFDDPVRLKNQRKPEVCCLCSTPTDDPIVVEIDPSSPNLVCTWESVIGLRDEPDVDI